MVQTGCSTESPKTLAIPAGDHGPFRLVNVSVRYSGWPVFKQPAGFICFGEIPYESWRQYYGIVRAGQTAGVKWLTTASSASAADPASGAFFAGSFYDGHGGTVAQALMLENPLLPGPQPGLVRWGPVPLASAGATIGAGVDWQRRALLITDGAALHGPGSVTAQWFGADGAALTGEFLVFDAAGSPKAQSYDTRAGYFLHPQPLAPAPTRDW